MPVELGADTPHIHLLPQSHVGIPKQPPIAQSASGKLSRHLLDRVLLFYLAAVEERVFRAAVTVG